MTVGPIDQVRRGLALAAARQATDAAAELLRFASEGDAAYGTFSEDVEVFEKLCDALKLVGEFDAQPTGAADYVETRDRVIHAVAAHIEGWVG